MTDFPREAVPDGIDGGLGAIVNSSLPRIFATCPFTVVSLIERSRAICLLLEPSASRAITSFSRSVRASVAALWVSGGSPCPSGGAQLRDAAAVRRAPRPARP